MKKIIRKLVGLAAVVVLAGSAQAANITMKGSDTLVILAQKWAEVYMQKNPDTKVQVTGGGSGTGFAALQNQQTDLANASRKIKPNSATAAANRKLSVAFSMEFPLSNTPCVKSLLVASFGSL